MESIRIGKVIAARRKERGITQEELAKHLGVSKPAVSKWESGQSYPDIVLLPVLASFFDISVDDLIGYEPQMSLAEVRKFYRRLANAFAKEPFNQVYQEIEQSLKKYFSCWQLQVQMGLLLINHLNLAGSQDEITRITQVVLELFERVAKSCEDVNLAKQALQYQALCYLCLNEPIPAIDILEDMQEPLISAETLLIKAYQMKGDKDKAIEYLQGYVYVNLIKIIGACSDYFLLYADQPDRMDIYYHKFMELAAVFDVDRMHPASVIKVHLIAAQTYVSQGNKEKAMDALEKYLQAATLINKDGFFLKGNEYFDALEGYFASIDIENDAPRNSEVIWKDIKNLVTANPVFAPLETEERYLKIKKKLEFEF